MIRTFAIPIASMVGAALACASWSAAAQSADAGERLVAASELVSISFGSEVLKVFSDQVTEPLIEALHASRPELDERTIVELRNELSEMLPQRVQETIKDVPAIYARHFSAQELRDQLAFYRTPVGVKSLRELPRVSQEISDAVRASVPDMVGEVDASFREILRRRGYRQ
jgi:hypothetical protein